ncbi:T9SS type A sorting domain-containing protein [Aureivirga sp. CE67]|uniref:T9SS type A sorting domain-containing protein n=1 Tax=Aureivirga sp. CE67 TaxID=1788983 RepID=UPI0018CA7FB3|nr:T9SS type A sorting domain-containing protein [Aureivirga sp. CE67]
MNKINCFLIISLLSLFKLNAQTGPGGIGHINNNTSGLIGWYTPDDIYINSSETTIPNNNDEVMYWGDRSFQNNNLFRQANSSDTYIAGNGVYNTSDSQNTYPVVSMANYSRRMKSTNGIQAQTLIVVCNPKANNTFEGVVGLDADKGIRRPSGVNNTWQSNWPTTGSWTAGANDDSWANSDTNSRSYVNGKSGGLFNNSWHIVYQERSGLYPSSGSRDLYLGGYFKLSGHGNRAYSGDIAEVIVLNQGLENFQRIIIENYLSAKYDIPLLENDIYTMDDPQQGNFDFHVAGLGRGMNVQNKARGTGILNVREPSDLGLGEYFIFGTNEKSLDLSFNFSYDTNSKLLSQIWRANEIGEIGLTTINIRLFEAVKKIVNNSSELNSMSDFDPCKIRLIVSPNADFSNKTSYALNVINADIATFQAKDVQINDEDYFTIEYVDQIVWDGDAFFHGASVDESPAMSDACMDMLVDSQNVDGMIATLSFNGTVKDLNVKAGNTLVLKDGVVLYIENELKLDGDIRLIGDAQIIQSHTGTSKVSGTGKLYRQRKSEHPTKFTVQYLCSPVSVVGSDSHDVFDILHTGGVYDETLYNGYQGITATSSHPDYNYVQNPHDANTYPLQLSDYWMWKFIDGATYEDWKFVRDPGVKVKTGEGFSIKGTGRDETYVFIGSPNDGTYVTSISSNNESLLGNPYPSAFDAHKFINDNLSAINGTLYFWDHVSAINHDKEYYDGGFASLNLITGVKANHINTGVELVGGKTPKQYLPIGQGFFVKGSSTGGTITFDNSQRVYKLEGDNSDETILLRNSNELGILKVSMGHKLESGSLGFRQIAVGFKNGLTTSHENGFDSEIIDMQPTDFYWNFEGNEKDYVIAGVSEFNLDQELPLVVKVENDEVMEFVLDEKINIDAKVFIKDTETHMSYELTDQRFEYFLEEGVYENRFKIVFKPSENLGVEEGVVEKSQLYFSNDTNEIIIKSNKNIDKVELYNLLGQRIFTKEISMKQNNYRIKVSETISEGVYIVKLSSEKGDESLKIKI